MYQCHSKLFVPILISLAALFFLLSSPAGAQKKKPALSTDSSTVIIIDTAGLLDSVIVIVDTVDAVDSVQQYYDRVNASYLKSYGSNMKQVATAPAHWEGRDWVKFAAITGTAGLLMVTLDKPVREVMLDNQNGTFTVTSKYVYPLGNRFPPLMLAGMYMTGLVTHNRRLEHASLFAAKSLVISTIVYTTTKSIIRRQRPTRTDDPLDFVAPFSSKGYTSFPSGHANTAFSVATAFALEYKDVKWVPWVAYSLATLTAVSRLYDDRHWASDVLIGASIGHFVTKGVYYFDQKRKGARKAKKADF